MIKRACGLPRAIELALASVTLIVSLPLVLLAGVLTALTSRGPILFRQVRVGRHGQPFTFYKFRTMRRGNGTSITSEGDPRITRVGAILRRTKIDELPSLWNVIKGDMRLVGPRPEVPRFVDTESALWREVLQEAPGITDPVTDLLRDEEKILRSVEGDRERFYVETLLPLKLQGYLAYQRSRSAWSDLRVLAWTALFVFRVKCPAETVTEALSQLRTGGSLADNSQP